jgi:hypothetical protein
MQLKAADHLPTILIDHHTFLNINQVGWLGNNV